MKRKVLLICCFFTVLSLVFACKKPGDTGGNEQTAGITIAVNGKGEIYVGESAQLEAVVTGKENAEVIWSVKEGGSFVTLDNGTITGVSSGNAVIKARVSNAADENENPVETEHSIEIKDKTEIYFQTEESVLTTFNINATNSLPLSYSVFVNDTQTDTDNIVWLSSNVEVGIVDNGTVTFFQEGETIITASFNDAVVTHKTVCRDFTLYTQISSYEEFQNINLNENTRKGKYVLTSDIDFGGINAKYTLSSFDGIFDGNGHKIYNFKIEAETGWGALFGNYITGTVRNLSLFCNTFKISQPGSVAVLVLAVMDGGVVDNVFVSAGTIQYPQNALAPVGNNGFAGIIAQNNYNGTIKNCIETGIWTSLNADASIFSGFNRIARNQQNGIFENNYSLIVNAPEISIPNPIKNKIIGYSQEISDSVMIKEGKGLVLKYDLTDFKIETQTTNTDIADIKGNVLIAKTEGETDLSLKFFSAAGTPIMVNNQILTVNIKVFVTSQSALPPEIITFDRSIISWDKGHNADSYILEIKDTAGAVNEIAVQGLSYDIGGYLTAGGKYEVRIKSISEIGTSTGYGNALEIYAISNKAEFIGIKGNSNTKHNILIADIDLGGQIYQSESITSISTGVFDGNGYKVYNFSIKPNYWGWASLLGTSLSGTIKNLSIYCDTYQIAQGGSSAIVTVAVVAGGLIDNVFVSVENLIYPAAALTPSGNNGYASIIAQANYFGTIKNCIETANWSSLNSDPENTNGFNRIARNQQGGIFENNYSMINNAPEEMANNSGSKIISYSQNDIAIETGETTALAALAGYTLEFVSDNQAAAQVNPATGEVNAAASGTANITVYFKKDGAYILANGQKLGKQIKVTVG